MLPSTAPTAKKRSAVAHTYCNPTYTKASMGYSVDGILSVFTKTA